MHYCLNVNDLVSRGLPGRQALTLALDSTGDRYLENNPWFQRLLQALRDADSSPSSEDSSQIAEQLMREILDDITADEPYANLF